jgi:quinol monooxygenase YgiN
MGSNSVRMNLTWSVPQGESRQIVSALQRLMPSIQGEAGCVGCSLSIDMRRRAILHYTEEWRSEDDLTRNLRSDKFAALAELMERASEYPSIEFVLSGSIRGADYAEEVRGSRAR